MPRSSRKAFRHGDTPVGVSTRRSGEFTVEELSEDDIGYDGDIEVVKAEYEEAESGDEEYSHDVQGDESIDSEDQLSHRLRGLYCDPSMVSSETQPSPRKGKKRMSKEMDGRKDAVPRQVRSELEVMELSVHTDDIQPAKRQKKRVARSKTGERIVRLISQDRPESDCRSAADSSPLAASPRPVEHPASPEADMMDVTWQHPQREVLRF